MVLTRDGMVDTALLLLDLQRDFLEADGRLTVGKGNAEPVILSANRLLNHAAKAGWKPILIKNEFRKRDWIGNFLRNDAAIEGAAGAEIDPRVPLPAMAPTFSKSRSDAFTNPALERTLKDASIRRLVVVGVMTEACVCATVKSAIRRGFEVTVVSDGVASTKESLKQSGLKEMQRAGAGLKECVEILSTG